MVKIEKRLYKNTPHKYGKRNKKKYIVVHQTGNRSEGAGAEAHHNLQENNSRKASWHISVDDKQAIQSFDEKFQLWHAGDGRTRNGGNKQGIAVELCINSDADYKKTIENGASVVKQLMEKHNIPLSNVRQHFHFSGKNCPAQIRAEEDGISWDDFKRMVEGKEVKSTPKKSSSTKGKSISQMADEIEAKKHGNGHENRRKSLGINKAIYKKVRAEVNRRAGVKATSKKKSKSISQMATEVIAQKHGNGHANRRKSLGVTQSVYDKVRAEVNKREGVSSKPSKSINQMATEVIDMKHGKGHTARRKSLGVTQATYDKVRAEVNKRLL